MNRRNDQNTKYKTIVCRDVKMSDKRFLEIALKKVKVCGETHTAVFLSEFRYDNIDPNVKRYGFYKDRKFIPFRQLVLPDDKNLLKKFISEFSDALIN